MHDTVHESAISQRGGREQVLDGGNKPGLIVPVIAAKPRPVPAAWKDRRWTFDELVAELPESNLPTELWDGELIMSPAPSFLHQQIVDRFHDLLKTWVRQHRLGETALAPIDMVMTTRRATQPDVVFIANERLGIIKERIMGAADLVAEVISPGSRRRDRIDKRDLYEQHGVREYWLIDPEAKTVEVLHLESGTYQLVGRWHPGERARSACSKASRCPWPRCSGRSEQWRGRPASGHDQLQLRGRMGKMRGIARDDAFGAFAPGKGRMERIVDTAPHNAALPRLRNRGLVIRQRQRINLDQRLQP